MAYTRGNLAVEEKISERVHGAPKYRETTKVVTRKMHLPIREKLLYMLTIACIVTIAGLLIWRNAYLYELKVQIHTSENNIKAVNSKITEYEVQKQKLLDMVPDKAAQYGFVVPDNGGIHVSEGNSDTAGSDTGSTNDVQDVPAVAKK